MKLEGKCLYDVIDRYYKFCCIPGHELATREDDQLEYETYAILEASGINTELIWESARPIRGEY